jgi:hypothetical protein
MGVRFRIILQSPDFAGYRRISPEITQNVAISRPKSPDKNPAICAELICSAWLSGDRNLLKSQQGFSSRDRKIGRAGNSDPTRP